jgi:DNA-binding NarL/FixJ family response regulator
VGGVEVLATEALALMLAKNGSRVVGVYPDIGELGSVLRVGQPKLQAAIVDGDQHAACLAGVAGIRRAHPELKILLLCEAVSPAVIRCAINDHIDGVALKSESIEEVVLALGHVLAGRAVMPVGWQAASLEAEPDARLAVLSAREREVLDLLTAGMSNDEIAERLVISCNTVKFHLRMIYSRLGVHNRVQAMQAVSQKQVDQDSVSNMLGKD